MSLIIRSLFLGTLLSVTASFADYDCKLARSDFKFDLNHHVFSVKDNELGQFHFGLEKGPMGFSHIIRHNESEITFMACWAKNCTGVNVYTCVIDRYDNFLTATTTAGASAVVDEHLAPWKGCSESMIPDSGVFIRPLSGASYIGDSNQNLVVYRVMDSFMTQYSIRCNQSRSASQ